MSTTITPKLVKGRGYHIPGYVGEHEYRGMINGHYLFEPSTNSQKRYIPVAQRDQIRAEAVGAA